LPPLRGALRCSTGQAAAELAALRQSSPKSPDQPALLGGAQGEEKRKAKTENRVGYLLIAKTIQLRYIGSQYIYPKANTVVQND